MLRRLAKVLGSLRLTAVLLFFSAVLVFFGTLDQVQYGIHATQKMYFQGFVAFWQYPPQWPGGQYLDWLHLPVPGGYLLGPLLLLNLIFAHVTYFRPRWRVAGIVAIHLGIALFLIGQLATDVFQEENFMWLDEGDTSNYLQSFRHDEIAVTDVTGPTQRTVSFPADHLRCGQVLEHEAIPFSLTIHEAYANALLKPGTSNDPTPKIPITRGVGATRPFSLIDRPPATQTNERNLTTAVVELKQGEESLGVWLLCNAFEDMFPPQQFEFAGHKYQIDLRFKRTPLPFDLTLVDFVHERYPGTDIPKHFASKVRLHNQETNENREVTIYMNHPLRYGGYTFYQASFAKSDTASMLQVVKNPGRLIPYIASSLIGFGLFFQFSWRLLHQRGGKRS